MHIHRVELLHRGQRCGLVGGEQGAFGHAGQLGPAGNRRDDTRAVQVDAGGLLGGLGHRHVGIGLRRRCLGLVIHLLADGVDLHQLGIPFGHGAGRGGGGFGLAHTGLGAGMGRLKTRRIDLVQHLPGLDQCTFGEQPLLQNAADLWPDLRHYRGHGAARQLGVEGHTFGLEGDHTDLFGRGCGRFGAAGVAARAAGEQQAGGQPQHHQGTRSGKGETFKVRHGWDVVGKTEKAIQPVLAQMAGAGWRGGALGGSVGLPENVQSPAPNVLRNR